MTTLLFKPGFLKLLGHVSYEEILIS